MHDLRDEVDDQEMVDRFAEDWRIAGLDAQTNALLEYTEKLTSTPASIDDSDIRALRETGLDDAGISSAAQVIAYFNYINRVADGLGVAIEDWIEPNGRVKPV